MSASTFLHFAVSSPMCRLMLHRILLHTVPFVYARYYFPLPFVAQQLTGHGSIRELVLGCASFLAVPWCLFAQCLHFSKPLLSCQAFPL